MRNAWSKPPFKLMSFLMPLIVISMGFGMSAVLHEFSMLLLVAIAILVTEYLAISMVMRKRMKDTWDSERRLYTNDVVDATNTLVEALRKAGYDPIKKERKTNRGWMTYDVGKGLNVTLIPTDRGVVGCVGPVTDASRRDVTAIEGLIDAVLAQPIKPRHEPGEGPLDG